MLELALETVGDRAPIVNGVYADGSLEAQRIARMAAEAGASGLLVFPPNVFRNGQRPQMAVEHFRRIAEVTDLPLVLFQYPLAGGMGYPLATLLKIIEAVPGVRGRAPAAGKARQRRNPAHKTGASRRRAACGGRSPQVLKPTLRRKTT